MENVHQQQVEALSALEIVELATRLLVTLDVSAVLPSSTCKSSSLELTEKLLDDVAVAMAAACPHLGDGCRRGVALALISLKAKDHLTDLQIRCATPQLSPEAVQAFYMTLHFNGHLRKMKISMCRQFSTATAAAHLGWLLNAHPTLQEIEMYELDFCGEAVWGAFSGALTKPNTSLHTLYVSDMTRGGHSGMLQQLSATLQGSSTNLAGLTKLTLRYHSKHLQGLMHLAGIIQHNVTLKELHLPMPGDTGPTAGTITACARALVGNHTLQILTIGDQVIETGSKGWRAVREDEAASLVELLRKNCTLKELRIGCAGGGGVRYPERVVVDGLSHNSTLAALSVGWDTEAAEALLRLLNPLLGGAACTQLRSIALWDSHVDVKLLTDMIAANQTLVAIDLEGSRYSEQDWAAAILPALAHNNGVRKLGLKNCQGVTDGVVWHAMLDLLEVNSTLEDINLDGTLLQEAGRAEQVKEDLRKNKVLRARMWQPAGPGHAVWARRILCFARLSRS